MRAMVRVGVLAAAVALLGACGDTDPVAVGDGASDGDPAGVWELTEGTGPEGELALADGYPVTLTIDDGQVGGTSACNHYGATLTRDGDSVRIGVVEGTAMGCEPDVMDLETSYLAALGDVDTVMRDDDTLTLTGPASELRFALVPPVPTADVIGTTWVLESLLDGETASSTMGDSATLVLEADGTLTGSTGCRELTGSYTETNGEILANELAAGDEECPDDLWAQDDHVVTVIGDGFRAAVDGDTLTLSSRGDLRLVYRARTG